MSTRTFRFLVTARFDEAELKRLAPVIKDVKRAGWGVTRQKLTEEELIANLSDADILVSEYENVTKKALESAKNLLLICCCRIGPEASVDIAAATRLRIPVLYTPGRNAVAVAEYTLGLMIGVARHIPEAHHLLRHTSQLTQVSYEDKTPDRMGITSEWSLDPRAPFNLFQGPELAGKVLGLVGCGLIGREIAKRAAAFGMSLYAFDPYCDQGVARNLGITLIPLAELVSSADFLVMAAKVTPETTGMISEALIRTMKPTAFFINTARASLVDYGALYRSLEQKRIAGAAIDVYPCEPLSEDDPFRGLDNVVLSPHLAGASFDVYRHHSSMFVEDLLRALKGGRPQALTNPDSWEGSRFVQACNGRAS